MRKLGPDEPADQEEADFRFRQALEADFEVDSEFQEALLASLGTGDRDSLFEQDLMKAVQMSLHDPEIAALWEVPDLAERQAHATHYVTDLLDGCLSTLAQEDLAENSEVIAALG
jgi:hypothetical protein